MGCSLSRIPDVNQPLTLKGLLTDSARLFLDVLQRIIDLDIEISYRVERFDSLLLLTERYPNPRPNQLAIRNGEGLAIYNDNLSIWVLASDDTTPIT